MKMLLASQVLYNPILAFSKISILLFYRSLTPDQNFHRYCAVTLIAVGCHAVAVFFGNLFQCTPIGVMMDHNLSGTCIDMGKFLLSTGAISSLLDLWIIIMPQRIILKSVTPADPVLLWSSLT